MRGTLLFATAAILSCLLAGGTWADGRAVVYLPAAEVDAAFARGVPLVQQADLEVHASRREAPGRVEVHSLDTDVIHVLEGTATLVTGGTMTGAETVSPGELRGAGIEGGDERQISKGDVLVVPRGVPHWFKAVPGPLLYYVVKVRRAESVAR